MNKARHTSVLCSAMGIAALLAASCAGGEAPAEMEQSALAGPTYYVAPGGSDTSGDGSPTRPWATIRGALGRVTDGSTILVKPGTYNGMTRLVGHFTTGVTVRSEVPYRALLRNTAQVILATDAYGITVEGFDIAHNPGAGPLVIQLDGQGNGSVHHITLKNNVIHDSYSNDLGKINNAVHDIRIVGNMFYNQSGSDEHLDINSVDNVVIEDNVFFNDFAGSGRTNTNTTSSFIVVKDSNEGDDSYIGSRNVTIRRNVMLNYQGGVGTGFFLCGEDGMPYFEAYNVMFENNLLLGNSPVPQRAALSVKGCRDVTFRNNTLSGDMPGYAYALRVIREGSNPAAQNIRLYNNIFSDPTGTMGDFSDTTAGEVASATLANNVFWNGSGIAIPSDSADTINYTNDGTRVLGNPALPDPRNVQVPRWSPSSGTFADGSTTIAEARMKLIEGYGKLGTGSAAVDKADAGKIPTDDIRSSVRGALPEVGAYDVGVAGGGTTIGALGTCKSVTGTTSNNALGSQSGIFRVVATLIPGAAGMDGGFGLSQGPVSFWAEAAAIVLFDPTGVMRARNGSGYAARNTIPYMAGRQYKLRMEVNVPSHTYSVWVTPQGGSEVALAENYAFRSESAAVTSLANWAVRAEIGSAQACDVGLQ